MSNQVLKDGDKCPTCKLLPYNKKIGILHSQTNSFSIICSENKYHKWNMIEVLASKV